MQTAYISALFSTVYRCIERANSFSQFANESMNILGAAALTIPQNSTAESPTGTITAHRRIMSFRLYNAYSTARAILAGITFHLRRTLLGPKISVAASHTFAAKPYLYTARSNCPLESANSCEASRLVTHKCLRRREFSAAVYVSLCAAGLKLLVCVR